VVRNCAIGGILLVAGAVIRTPVAKAICWFIGAVLMFRAFWILRGPAEITNRCISTSARGSEKAIRAAVSAATCHEGMSESEKVSHLTFLQYLNNTTVGAEMFGIMITPALIFRIFMSLVTNIPIGIGILESLMEIHDPVSY